MRPATGSVVERKRKSFTSFGLRFTANGKREYVTLKNSLEGMTPVKAQEELDNVLADVRRGIWRPPVPVVVEQPIGDPTFHEFADEVMAIWAPELRPKTISDYVWALERHLLPVFGEMRLKEITEEKIDRYRAQKLKQGKLSNNSVNKTITRLGQVLEVAVDYKRLDHNPAKGKRRKAKANKVKRSWLEVEQITCFIEAASRNMRPVVAVLIGCGLRIGECCALDCERPRNGVRARHTVRNVEARFPKITKEANKKLADLGIERIDHITPHGLRRTFASLRAALRDDPVYIAEQGGWTDVRFVFSVYQKAAKRREKLSGRYLDAFDAGLSFGTNRHQSKTDEVEGLTYIQPESPQTVSESQI
jgi:integrase